MQGLSERQYAARVGLSRGAIQKAKEAGRLVLFADGSIDLDASDQRRAEMIEQAIRATEARTYLGADAIEKGLVDRMATLDEVISALSQPPSGAIPQRKRGPMTSTTRQQKRSKIEVP